MTRKLQSSCMREKPDFVALVAWIAAASSFIAPYVMLKPNRVVDGEPLTGAALAGPVMLAWITLTGLLFLSFIIIPHLYGLWPHVNKRLFFLAAGIFCIWLCAALIVKAVTMDTQRISLALGFWGLPTAAYIFISHAKISKVKNRKFILMLTLVFPVLLILWNEQIVRLAVVQEFLANKTRFVNESFAHLKLFSLAIIFASAFGIPLGILASRYRKTTGLIISFVDGAQTIPSLAMFGLLMAPLAALSRAYPLLRSMGIKGIGDTPALIALSLYALLPVVRNTVAGLASVPDPVLETGRGMGMSARQLFKDVKWPVALPYILTGLRTASVQTVGNAAVAALIGAGGLGILIFQGLGQAAPDMVLLGVIPLVILALSVDRMWAMFIRFWVSPGLARSSTK